MTETLVLPGLSGITCCWSEEEVELDDWMEVEEVGLSEDDEEEEAEEEEF